MQIQLIVLSLLLCFSVIASDESEMKLLFTRYDQVMSSLSDQVEDVFSKKFLEENGGKEGFQEKIKGLAKSNFKSMPVAKDLSFKKGVKSDLYFAKYTEKRTEKSLKGSHTGSQFIIVREDGKLKIDGTLSDGE